MEKEIPAKKYVINELVLGKHRTIRYKRDNKMGTYNPKNYFRMAPDSEKMIQIIGEKDTIPIMTMFKKDFENLLEKYGN
jgi:hypothetical protein